MDRAIKALSNEVWQIPAVVDMRMRENHSVNLGRLKGEIEVSLVRMLAPTLVQTAIEQDAVTVNRDEMA
jgi:hypothetical protein